MCSVEMCRVLVCIVYVCSCMCRVYVSCNVSCTSCLLSSLSRNSTSKNVKVYCYTLLIYVSQDQRKKILRKFMKLPSRRCANTKQQTHTKKGEKKHQNSGNSHCICLGKKAKRRQENKKLKKTKSGRRPNIQE